MVGEEKRHKGGMRDRDEAEARKQRRKQELDRSDKTRGSETERQAGGERGSPMSNWKKSEVRGNLLGRPADCLSV